MSAAPAQTLSTPEGFLSGALAASCAVTVTNIMEVAKTRLQLDGELGKSTVVDPATGKKVAGKKVYTSAWDALRKTYKFEGVRGLQRGLGAAYCYQFALNGSRLGFYEPLRLQINQLVGYSSTDVVAWTSITAGASSGIIGARMQAYSPFNPVGAQHAYPSAISGLRSIVRSEGLRGLTRGVDAAMLRTAMGSSVQLPAYGLAKKELKALGMEDGAGMFLLASTFSGMVVCAVMQPADTALTRMYNQAPNSIGPDGLPRGLLYKNPIDCLYKTWKAEGVRGWYKGSTAHLARIAPHTIITLVANEFITRQWLAVKASSISRD